MTAQNERLRFLEHRIADRRLLRLIRKWLKAGVVEEGRIVRSEKGAPQGAVVSPTLANVYLHYVYDLWINAWRNHNAVGDVAVIRYADDTVVGFQTQRQAERFLEALHQRLEKFGLSLHPEKTRLIRFGRYASEQCRRRDGGKPETFDFLGFTHYCTTSYKTGWFKVGRKTKKKSMLARLKAIKEELRQRINRPISETGRWLRKVLRGHLNYFAVPGNGRSLSCFFYRVAQYWIKILRRRSQRHRMTWERFAKIRDFFFPIVQILHPYPLHRFDAKTRGKSPVR